MSTQRLARLLQFGVLAAVLGLWILVTETGYVSPIFLPRVPVVIGKFFDIVVSGEFINPLLITLFEVACAYLVAVVLGTSIGFFVSRSEFSTRVFEPLFSSIFTVPLIIFYPLLMLFFGLGVGSKIALGALVSFFPIVLNTVSGFNNVPPLYKRAAQSMGASGFQLFRRVLVPAAFPVILTGLRIGFILCFLSIIGAETIGSLAGLGRQIVFNAESMNTSGMFAWIVFVVIIAAVLNVTVQWLEKKGEYVR